MATILLCFLPLASYADIYICLPRHYAEANQNFTMVVNKDEFDDESEEDEEDDMEDDLDDDDVESGDGDDGDDVI